MRGIPLPLKRGFLYLVAIMDWHSRAVLSWRLSNAMDTEFCVAALEEAMNGSGVSEIFTTDQGPQGRRRAKKRPPGQTTRGGRMKAIRTRRP